MVVWAEEVCALQRLEASSKFCLALLVPVVIKKRVGMLTISCLMQEMSKYDMSVRIHD